MEINALFAVALILLLALLAGRLAKLIHIPEVTGYLVAGLALGPSGVNLISEQTLTALNFLSEIAIGLILFSIGSVFEFANLQRVGKRVISLVAFEALGAGVLVVAGMFWWVRHLRRPCCWGRWPWLRRRLRPSWCCANTTPPVR